LELTWLVCSRWYGWLCNNVHMFIIMHTVGPLTETPWGNKFIITAPLPDKTAVGVVDFLFCRTALASKIHPDSAHFSCCTIVTQERPLNMS
jgi:hypothetical protein